MNSAIILIIAFVGLFFLMLMFFVSRYIKCPPNKALVIYGRTADGNVQILAGGSEFIWPVIQDYKFLDLTPFNQEIETEFISKDLISIPAKLSIDYGISANKDLLKNAAERLLGKERLQIEDIAHDIILGAVKKVFSSNDLVTIATSREKILKELVAEANQILNQIGIQLMTFRILYQKNQEDHLKELEQKFKASKLANFDVVNQNEVEQKLDNLNQKIEVNAQERLELVQKKLDLLAKLKTRN